VIIAAKAGKNMQAKFGGYWCTIKVTIEGPEDKSGPDFVISF